MTRFDLHLKDVPAACNPSWAALSRPMLAHLRQVRSVSIDDLVAWGVEQKLGGAIARQTLAWLSFRDLVHYDDAERAWVPGPPPRAESEISESKYVPEAQRLVVARLPESLP